MVRPVRVVGTVPVVPVPDSAVVPACGGSRAELRWRCLIQPHRRPTREACCEDPEFGVPFAAISSGRCTPRGEEEQEPDQLWTQGHTNKCYCIKATMDVTVCSSACDSTPVTTTVSLAVMLPPLHRYYSTLLDYEYPMPPNPASLRTPRIPTIRCEMRRPEKPGKCDFSEPPAPAPHIRVAPRFVRDG